MQPSLLEPEAAGGLLPLTAEHLGPAPEDNHTKGPGPVLDKEEA